MAKIFRIVDNILGEYFVNYKYCEKSGLCAKNTSFVGFWYDEILEKELLDKCLDM